MLGGQIIVAMVTQPACKEGMNEALGERSERKDLRLYLSVQLGQAVHGWREGGHENFICIVFQLHLILFCRGSKRSVMHSCSTANS